MSVFIDLISHGDCHSRCNNHEAKVKGDFHGIRSEWFMRPLNFDPIWLKECNGFSNDKKEYKKADPLMELMAILR